MDLSQIIAAQKLPANQYVFDADIMDQKILRAEQRRRNMWNLGLKIYSQIKALAGFRRNQKTPLLLDLQSSGSAH